MRPSDDESFFFAMGVARIVGGIMLMIKKSEPIRFCESLVFDFHYEDEGRFLAAWGSGGQIRSLCLHCPLPGDQVSFGPFAGEIV